MPPPLPSADFARRARQPVRAVIAGLCALVVACGLAGCRTDRSNALPPLTTAASVLALPATAASDGRQVRIRGRVTFFDGEWRLLTFEDQTGIVVVDPGEDGYFSNEGEEAVITGRTVVRDGQVVVQAEKLDSLARRPREIGPPAGVADVVAGRRDGRRVEVHGTMRDATMSQARLRLVVAEGDRTVVTWVRVGSVSDAAQFVGQEVRVRGVPLRATPAARQRGESELFVDNLGDVLHERPAGIAATPITDAASVRRLSNGATALRHRVRLHGVVTYYDPSWRLVFVQDDTAGVYVNTQGATSALRHRRRGGGRGRDRHRRLRAVGHDATIRAAGRLPWPKPIAPPLDALRSGAYDAQWVVVIGRHPSRLDRQRPAPVLRAAHRRPDVLRAGAEPAGRRAARVPGRQRRSRPAPSSAASPTAGAR